ncbi:MAG: YbaK/EbsC family protein [Caldiserica bacterium]|nr:YbaK/EbsC family protein [Caldisericota bacterium]
MKGTLSPSAEKVQNSLYEAGYNYQVIELSQTTRSAQEAAQAVGCQVGQIVKSLIFRAKESNRAILVVASGQNRVNEARIASHLGEPIEKADAEFVKEKTGFTIGGVPPLGHKVRLETFVDEDLLKYDVVWAAAGTPYAVFALSPSDLVKMTGGKVISIK